MAEKIEITVTKDYVGSWGEYEGIREIIQNGIDGEQEYGCELKVSYTPNGKLAVENIGGSIPKEALLIGFTTKRDNDELIGKFGEGLKLGVLALLRAGNTVKIKNNGEIWTPVIEQSDNFNAEVLKFKITKAKKPAKGLRVLIGGINREKWNRYKRSFLVLKKKTKTMISTYHGDLLTDCRHAGRIYVKGIEVEWHDDLVFGYNFRDADVDRDRKMISSWDLEYKMGQILGAVMSSGYKYKRKIYQMLKDGARDVKRLDYAGESVGAAILKEFEKEYGNASIPVANNSEAREVGHYGKKGVVVPEAMASVVKTKLGNMDEIRQKLCEATFKVMDEADLTPNQQRNYRKALEMIRKVKEVDESKIQIVAYKDNTLGQYVAGRIRIGARALLTLKESLCTLVHEICHGYGRDGEKSFVSQVEYMLAEIAIANMPQDDTFSVDKGA
jgi:hypothetical protein